MEARGPMRTPWASMTLVIFLLAAGWASAWDQKQYRFPIKVRVSGSNQSDARTGTLGTGAARWGGEWDTAAGVETSMEIVDRNRLLTKIAG